MEEIPHSSGSWKLELWRKITLCYSLAIVANVKNNYCYRICLYFNWQFSQIQWFKILFLYSRIICCCLCSLPNTYLDVLELLGLVFWVSLLSSPDKISSLLRHMEQPLGTAVWVKQKQNLSLVCLYWQQSKIWCVLSVIIYSSAYCFCSY